MTGMTGPAHYREAERLLVHTDRSVEDQFGEGAECARQQIAMAQVHATLAAAAATALGAHELGMRAAEFSEWHEAAGKETGTRR